MISVYAGIGNTWTCVHKYLSEVLNNVNLNNGQTS